MTYWLLGIGFVIVLYFVFLAWTSQKPPALGMIDGKLRPCPNTPNCVGSEYAEQTHFVDPLPLTPKITDVELAAVRQKMEHALRALGGDIQRVDPNYIWATFSTPLFRYVDDMEVRFTDEGLIHVRSASRVGRSDFGQNKKRVAALRAQFLQ